MENTTSANTRIDKSKTFYVSEKDYYKLGSSHLDKSVGESSTNGRKSENVYARVSTSNHPYRKRWCDIYEYKWFKIQYTRYHSRSASLVQNSEGSSELAW